MEIWKRCQSSTFRLSLSAVPPHGWMNSTFLGKRFSRNLFFLKKKLHWRAFEKYSRERHCWFPFAGINPKAVFSGLNLDYFLIGYSLWDFHIWFFCYTLWISGMFLQMLISADYFIIQKSVLSNYTTEVPITPNFLWEFQ